MNSKFDSEIEEPDFNKWYSLLLHSSKEEWQKKVLRNLKQEMLKQSKLIKKGKHEY